jgi:hypothetical protein
MTFFRKFWLDIPFLGVPCPCIAKPILYSYLGIATYSVCRGGLSTKTKKKRDEKLNLIGKNLSKYFNFPSSPRTETCCWAAEGEGQVGQTDGSRGPLEDWDGVVTDMF